jgi:hypothetical protein
LESLAAGSRDDVANLCGGNFRESLTDFVDRYIVEETTANGEE